MRLYAEFSLDKSLQQNSVFKSTTTYTRPAWEQEFNEISAKGEEYSHLLILDIIGFAQLIRGNGTTTAAIYLNSVDKKILTACVERKVDLCVEGRELRTEVRDVVVFEMGEQPTEI